MMVSLGMSDFYVTQTAVRFVYYYCMRLKCDGRNRSQNNYRSFSSMQFAGVRSRFGIIWSLYNLIYFFCRHFTVKLPQRFVYRFVYEKRRLSMENNISIQLIMRNSNKNIMLS